jgi:exopolysaccharide biosynthesis polyprenyl glycosylphosphotransferase
MLTQHPESGRGVEPDDSGILRSSSIAFLRRRRDGSSARARAAAALVHAEPYPVWESLPGVQDRVSATGCSASLRRDAIFRRALAVADVAAAYCALVFAITVVSAWSVSVNPAVALVAPFVLIVSKAIGLYDRDQHVLRKTTIDEVPSILQLSVLYAAAAWFAETLLFGGQLERSQVFLLAGASFVSITVGRSLARRFAREATSPERYVVLGSDVDTARIVRKLSCSPRVRATLVGRVALHGDTNHGSTDHVVLGKTEVLAQLIDQYRVERVIIVSDSHDQEEILHAVRLSKALGVKVSVLPRLLEVVGSSSSYDDVDGLMLLGVRQYGLAKSSELLKRTMDVVGGAIGLVLLAPLFLVLAIAIKLDTRGPVFFRQPRIGHKGKHFRMFKFRSMVRDAERSKAALLERNEAEGGLFKISDDPRITRVGRLLRRTSLDELPQLLNVIQGSMSLVGPRPFVPDEDALIEGWERRRLTVRPGMTGLWQIFGSSRVPKSEMVKIDYLYSANWSMWLDLKILLRTVPYVLGRRGL